MSKKEHLKPVTKLLHRYQLGVKIRDRVCRRRLRTRYWRDPIGLSLAVKCQKYYELRETLRKNERKHKS